MNLDEVRKLKEQELALHREKLRLKESLPHLYGYPWYSWAKEVFESVNRFGLLTAGNQLSKSSTQIRKCIHWATDKSLWPKLWPSSISQPNVFWYFYPTMDVAEEEWQLKWSLFMPRDRDCPVYGWREVRKNNKIYQIEFNSGVTVIFKSYAQSIQDLQTGTIYAVFADEELPLSHFPEIQARLNATDGYFSMVFTATLGQEYWRKSIEGGGDEELHPDADKWQVSLFDCVTYADGSPSPWTFEKIKRACLRAASNPDSQNAIKGCETLTQLQKIVKDLPDPEIQRRIMGKFVFVGGRKFEAFRRERNVSDPHPLPSNWLTYTGVDYGSGGESGHPAAMVFVGVSPDFKMGRVYRARRMDGVLTTAQDVLDEYLRVRGKIVPVLQTYDWSSKDFHTFASRRGISFQKAEKDQDWGVGTLNTLFKSGMLKIYDDDPELEKLITELMTLKATTLKRDAADDLCDALRYAVMAVPWDWSALDEVSFDEEGRLKEPKAKPVKTEIDLRREFHSGGKEQPEYTPDVEMDEWDSLINEFDG